MSYLAGRSTVLLNLLLFPGTLLVLFAAAWSKSMWPIWVLAIAFALELIRVVYYSPMIEISEDQAIENRRLGKGFLFLFLAIAGGLWWLVF